MGDLQRFSTGTFNGVVNRQLLYTTLSNIILKSQRDNLTRLSFQLFDVGLYHLRLTVAGLTSKQT